MSQSHVADALLRFHLGASDDAEHEQVDAHLLDCRGCLSEFLSLKRRFDSATAVEERPSPLARERLRKELRRRLPSSLARPRTWALGAAIAAGLLVLFWVRAHSAATAPGAETLIDTGQVAQVAQVL
jgi:hypothetical protein